jgi:hypothetical protein
MVARKRFVRPEQPERRAPDFQPARWLFGLRRSPLRPFGSISRGAIYRVVNGARRPLVLVAGGGSWGALMLQERRWRTRKGQCGPFPQNTARRDIDGWADLDRLSALHNHEP